MSGRVYSDEICERIIEMREVGKTYVEIAAALGCSASTASWICLKAGAVSPKGFRPGRTGSCIRGGRPVRAYSQDDDTTLSTLEAEGLNYAEIARRLGRTRNSVHARLLTLARREEQGPRA